MPKSQVVEERLGDYVVTDCNQAFKIWWTTIDSSAIVKVRYPHERHRNAIKVSNSTNPCDLNKAIKREYYPMRTIEEISTNMPNPKYFSVLDASSGFWQVKLNHDNAKLCTFNTPFG